MTDSGKRIDMKHVFIVNPAAGPGDATEEIREKLAGYTGYDWEMYTTSCPGDATVFVRKYIAEHPGEEVRFYACGGDGTANEVAYGLYGSDNAGFTIYPSGSGNDFVKYYGGKERFLDIGKLLEAEDTRIDLLKINDRISVNVINFGFDTCVARTMMKVKRKKIIGGKRAYYTGIVYALAKAMKNECSVIADGEELSKGKILLCTLANGWYVGGSFKCAPRAKTDDGIIDVCLVNPISRLKFVKLLPSYTEGNHLDDPAFKDIMTYRRAKKITVEGPEGFAVTLDGEIVAGTHFDIEVIPLAVKFAVPKGE